MQDPTVYSDILSWIGTLSPNHGEESERAVSGVLANAGMMVAYLWLALSLLWLTTKSMLLKRTPVLYLFSGLLILCGLSHLAVLVGGFPLYAQLALDFVTTTTALFAALLVWQKRSFIVGLVYQFKYVVGLVRNLERLDQTERKDP